MIAQRITLSHFRNIKQAEVSFLPGVNVLYGDNAQGKTNLLEAIYFASIGKSFRGQHQNEVISFGEDSAMISLDYHGCGRDQNVTMRLFAGRTRTIEKNKVRIGRMSELVGGFRAVLFSPEHLSLIKDGPAERRQFLDIAISAAEPLYLASLQRYARILKQRNALIKSAEKNPADFHSTVDIWSRQLAQEGAFLAKARERYVKKAASYVSEAFIEMTGGGETPTLVYKGPCGRELENYEDTAATEAALYHKLSTNHEKELGAEATLYGIHKDDVEIFLNGKEARLYCSQGQQRSLALALKLAEGEICRADCGEYPVFLFDDVLSELDSGRREYLLQKLSGKQVILTTCEKAGFDNTSRIEVIDGHYEKFAPSAN